MRLTQSVDIQAPPDAVWTVWADVERWPEWTASMSRVEFLDPGPLAVGVRARVRQPKFPPAVWRVTDVQPGRRFTWVSSSPGARVTATHAIEPRVGGSRATMTIVFEGPVGRFVGWITRALSERYMKMEGAGLKARSEGRAAQP